MFILYENTRERTDQLRNTKREYMEDHGIISLIKQTIFMFHEYYTIFVQYICQHENIVNVHSTIIQDIPTRNGSTLSGWQEYRIMSVTILSYILHHHTSVFIEPLLQSINPCLDWEN